MSRFARLLLALLLVVALAGAAALAIGYRTGLIARQSVFEVATTGDIRDLFAPRGAEDSILVNLSLRKLESDYYKPIDPQTPITGEATALRALLSEKKVGNATLPAESANGNPSQDGERAADVLAFAQQHYAADVGPNGREDLAEAALRGMMSSVRDPYTVYLSPREIQGLNESLSGGNFGGIGVYIYQLKDGRIIVQPIESMPAARAGMKPGDIVDGVDGKPVRGLNIDRVEELIRGEAGTTAHLRVHAFNAPPNAPSAERAYAIVRDIIHVPTVRAKMEDGLDYIRLSDFGTTSADEIRKALLDGRAHGARGYILDLRDNGGGLLDAAVAISSYFIPQGTIVSTIRRDGQRTRSQGGTRRCDRRPPSARSSREQVHRKRLGDHRGCAGRLPPCHPRGNPHVWQRRRAEHLPAPRPRRAKDHDGPVRDAGRPGHPASRHRARRRGRPECKPGSHRHARRQAAGGGEGTIPRPQSLVRNL